jgi:hypothetical protein
MSELIRKDQVTYENLPQARRDWVDYNAVQGMVTNSDGSLSKMTVDEFASRVGISRKQCYEWSKIIPGFWDMVNARRREIGGGARTQKVWNSVFVSATVKLNPMAQKIWLANHDPNYREPTQKVEHEVGGGLLDLMTAHRKRLQVENKVVNDESDIAG